MAALIGCWERLPAESRSWHFWAERVPAARQASLKVGLAHARLAKLAATQSVDTHAAAALSHAKTAIAVCRPCQPMLGLPRVGGSPQGYLLQTSCTELQTGRPVLGIAALGSFASWFEKGMPHVIMADSTGSVHQKHKLW